MKGNKMQSNQTQAQPQVLPLPTTIGAELKAGGPKRSTKAKTATKGAVHTVKSGTDLQKIADMIAAKLEAGRTSAVMTYLEAAKLIKEPANIVDEQKVLQATLTAKRFPSAATRASEFAAVAYAWHHDPSGVEYAIILGAPKMKDRKEVTDDKGDPIMLKPSETLIMKRIRVIRSHIPEGEPGFTKKGNRETKTATKLNATQFARLLDYLKLMDKAQWEQFADKFEAEAAHRNTK